MLRAVDMQQIISQISSVEKIQSVEQQQPGMEHRHFATQLKEEDARNRSEVKESQETKETEIRDEDKRRKKRKGQKRAKAFHREGDLLEATERPPEVDQGKIVDILV